MQLLTFFSEIFREKCQLLHSCNQHSKFEKIFEKEIEKFQLQHPLEWKRDFIEIFRIYSMYETISKDL